VAGVFKVSRKDNGVLKKFAGGVVRKEKGKKTGLVSRRRKKKSQEPRIRGRGNGRRTSKEVPSSLEVHGWCKGTEGRLLWEGK